MKKFICSLLVMIATLPLLAQDVIMTKTGDEIQAKVLKINDSIVEYKEFSNQEGQTLNMNVTDIFMIKYENGEKDVFGIEQHVLDGDESAIENDDMIYYDKSNMVTYHGVTYKYTEVGDIIRKNPEAYNKYRGGKTMAVIGDVLTFVGGFGIGYGLGSCIAGKSDSWKIALVGVGVCAVSLPLVFIGERNVYKSFEIYNDSVKNNNTAYLDLGLSETGGLAVRLRF